MRLWRVNFIWLLAIVGTPCLSLKPSSVLRQAKDELGASILVVVVPEVCAWLFSVVSSLKS